jgi:single-strand DNA-binding protein
VPGTGPGSEEERIVYETTVTVTGVVATDPRAVVVDETLPITSFRLASTPRRRDRNGNWTDGETSWLTVTCWRGLARNVASSVGKRDRVVVHGRLRVREWTSPEGVTRTTVEVDADAVGHDLSWGTAQFTRARRVEVMESAGRAEAEDLVRSIELEEPPENLEDLLDPEGEESAAVPPPTLEAVRG